MKKYILSIILIVLFVRSTQAQVEAHGYPVIGEPCPDFVIGNVADFRSTQVSSDDLKGRFVILDFWHRHCTSCIRSFPKTNRLAEKFKENVDIIAVGLEDRLGLKPFYASLKAKYGLSLPIAFDSVLYRRFVPGGAAPHYVWIDDKGIVKAVTAHIDEDKIERFMRGESFDFVDFSYAAKLKRKRTYDWNKPFLLDGNGGDGFDVRYRSMLLNYVPNEMPMKTFYTTLHEQDTSRLLEGIANLTCLYRMAYFGHYTWTNDLKKYPIYAEAYRDPILELPDTTAFDADSETGANYFWYSLLLPPGKTSSAEKMRVMQSDLFINFGYQAGIEWRELPYWSITASSETLQRLKTTEEFEYYTFYTDGHSYLSYRNYPFDALLQRVFSKIFLDEPPILSETGFDGCIDIDLPDFFLTDFDAIREELQRQGIRLQKKRKLFKALVIRPTP